MNISRADLSDLQELAESFSQLGIMDLVNVKANETLHTNPGIEEVESSNTTQVVQNDDYQTRAYVTRDINTNIKRSTKTAPNDSPWAKTMSQPINPYGNNLNLDVIDFRNIEDLITEWVSSMKIAVSTLDLDKNNFIKLIELSLIGSAKYAWNQVTDDVKAGIYEGDSKSTIADRAGNIFRILFIGEGYFEEKESEKKRINTQYLMSIKLESICSIDEYIYWFRKYYFQSKMVDKEAIPLFFANICSPWREMLIQSYKLPVGAIDSVARRMSFTKEKIGEWCQQAKAQKNMKQLRRTIKRTPLCCDNNDFPTIIGESREIRKRKKNRNSFRNFRKPPFQRRRPWWTKNKARSYKSGQRSGATRSSSQGSTNSGTRSTGRTNSRRTFRRAHTRANESFKDCNCWKCGAKGHISPDCPQNRGEIRKFEATDDILDAVYYGNLIPVHQFEEIPSDESIYEEELKSDSNSSSDGSSTESD